MPVSLLLVLAPGLTERIPTMMMGTMRPPSDSDPSPGELAELAAFSGEDDAFCAPLGVVAVPNLNMRKKFRGTLPEPGVPPFSSVSCPACLRAEANLPLSSDCKKLLNVPSSPSPATLRASAMACWFPSSKVAAVAAAATDSSLDNRAVLSSPAPAPTPSPVPPTGDRRLLPERPLAPRSPRRLEMLGRRKLDLREVGRGVEGLPALTVVVRSSKLRSRSGTETSGKLKSRAWLRAWSKLVESSLDTESDGEREWSRSRRLNLCNPGRRMEPRARSRREGRRCCWSSGSGAEGLSPSDECRKRESLSMEDERARRLERLRAGSGSLAVVLLEYCGSVKGAKDRRHKLERRLGWALVVVEEADWRAGVDERRALEGEEAAWPISQEWAARNDQAVLLGCGGRMGSATTNSKARIGIVVLEESAA